MNNTIDDVAATVNHIESDLILDRGRIDKLVEGQANILTKMQNIYDRLQRVEDKRSDHVAEVVQPVIDSVDNLTKQIKKAGEKS
jgi:hypothetical protein